MYMDAKYYSIPLVQDKKRMQENPIGKSFDVVVTGIRCS